jgi:hypothetical protein
VFLCAGDMTRCVEFGELVRAGQDEGTVRPPSQSVGKVGNYGMPRAASHLPAPSEYFSAQQEQKDSYALANASPGDFGQAIEEAKTDPLAWGVPSWTARSGPVGGLVTQLTMKVCTGGFANGVPPGCIYPL